MSDTVEKIKERLTIVDVVQPYLKLTRAGKYWKGLSPFTKEKTPSFFVSPDKGLYHCFSTGKGGDMFTFVQEMESVDFKGALKVLAEKAGVELTQVSRESRDEREQLFAALDAATLFYIAELKKRPDVVAYLTARGLDQVTVDHWKIGYAPKDWRLLKEHLLQKGFSDETLLAAGLVKKPDREDASGSEVKSYDRFRGRILFPIFDASGRVTAFSGRIFEDDPTHPQAKYLNSPEGVLFDKSRALYGIHEAKSGIRTLGFSMLVEGQVDLVLMHQLGYRSAVATSGTSLTASHVEILKRYSLNVLLAYDGDKAGISATYRAALLLLSAGCNVKVVALPLGKDPADMAVHDVADLKERIKHAEPVITFFVTHLRRTVTDDRTRLLEVGRLVLPLVAKVQNALDQEHFIKQIAESISASESALRAELKKLPAEGSTVTQGKNPFFADDARESLLFGLLRTYEDTSHPSAERVRNAFIAEFGSERLATDRARGDGHEEAARIMASENFFMLQSGSDEAEKLTELLDERRPEMVRIKAEYEALTKALKLAENEHNDVEVERLMTELRTLSKKLE